MLKDENLIKYYADYELFFEIDYLKFYYMYVVFFMVFQRWNQKDVLPWLQELHGKNIHLYVRFTFGSRANQVEKAVLVDVDFRVTLQKHETLM